MLKKTFKYTSFLFLLVTIIWFVIPFKSIIEMDYGQQIFAKDGELLRVFLNNDEQWCYPPIDSIEIPEKLGKAVIIFEDEYFYKHPGINPVSVFRAIKQNIKAKRVISGASTLTMQVARLRSNHSRTISNKILEALTSIKLELHYSKKKILAAYLNHAPYGGNIVGYRAASIRYFQKKPDQLSWAEAATLAVLPNAPSIVSPEKDRSALVEKRNKLLKKLLEKQIINPETYRLALLESVPTDEFPVKIVAPHLTQRINSAHSDLDTISTSINFKLQQHCEYIAAQYAKHLKRLGIENLSFLVVNNQNSKVEAYIGSQDFFQYQKKGQIDGIWAPRSSGSILKPFLYALAIDDGLITPFTQIHDIPTYFDGFAPQNANEKFNGMVRASDALIRSLNVPAIRLLNSYGIPQFYTFLKEAGVSTLFRTSEGYGLPIILGGAEVNVWDMAKLYHGLANGGSFSDISFYKKIESRNPKQLISRGACMQTLDVMKELKRPGAEYYWQQYNNQHPVAWKTGTSYGHKDAWAVGTTPDWTVAVWVGNFSGDGNNEILGAKIAGPLLFDVFNHLENDSHEGWFEYHKNDFKTLTICSETGFIAGPWCDHKKIIEVPVGMRPLKVCPFHTRVEVNKENTHEVCSACWEDGHTEQHVLIYPPEVVHQFRKRGILLNDRLPHNPNCKHITSIEQMEFIYPKDSARIWIPRDYDGKTQQVVIKLAHQSPDKKVFWYNNQSLIGTTNNKHQLALELKQGWHKIIALDENGSNCSTTFQVARK